MMKKLSVVLCLCTLAACAGKPPGQWEPIVDLGGVSRQAYERDLAECREYAAQVDIAGRGATGAAGGAVIGGVLGAVIGDGETARTGAGAGAVTGAARGGLGALEEKHRVLRNCLLGRGYRVLN